MELADKINYLNEMGTGDLIKRIQEQENTLEALMIQDAKYKAEHVRFLAGWDEDCTEVKVLLAKLSTDPPLGPDGKKATVAQVEAWLRYQRETNPELMAAITSQNDVTFTVENNRVTIDMARRRLDSLRGVLALRTAQINFLKE